MDKAILCLDILSYIAIVVLSKLTFRSLRNPVFIICTWWSAFLTLSNIIRIGDGIHFTTHLIFLLFIYSILGFGIFFHALIPTVYFQIPRVLTRYKKALLISSILLYLLTILLGAHGYNLQTGYGADYRQLSFDAGDSTSLLYGTTALQAFAGFVLSPIVLFGLIALPLAGVYYGKYSYLVLGYVFSAAVCFQSSSRGFLYFSIQATVLGFIFVKETKLWLRITFIAAAFASVLLMLDITKVRAGAEITDGTVIEEATDQLVKYHVVGAYLFDQEFSNQDSMLHGKTSLGRLCFFSYPDTIICMFLRRFRIDAVPEVSILGEYWQRNVFLGNDRNGKRVEINAAYTLLYPLFYDFGYLGIILVPGVFVYVLLIHYKAYVRQRSFLSLFVVVFIIIFFLVSIITVKITSFDFTVIFYSILFLQSVRASRENGSRLSRVRQ